MKRRLRLWALGLATAAVIAAGVPTPQAPAASGSQVVASCKRAKIGGKRKCIARGQYCSRRYHRDYKRYGFSCSKRDRNGRYHLR